MIWRMFMSVTMESAVFIGKELAGQLSFHREYKRSHIESNVRHIYKIGVWTRWDLWIGNNWLGKSFMEIFVFDWWKKKHQSSAHTEVYVISDSVLCLGKIHENSQSNDAWEDRLGWFKSSPEYRNFDKIDGEPMDFEWNIFPGFNTLQLSDEVKSLLLKLGETPENFHSKIEIHVDVQRHLLWVKEQWKRIVWQMPISFLYMQQDLEKDNGHLLVLVVRKSGYSTSEEDSPQGECDNMAVRMLLELAESAMSNFFSATSPLSRGPTQKQRPWKIVDTLLCRFGNDWDYSSHICFWKSAQSLRSSRRNVCRVRNPSRSNVATRCGRAIKFLTRAKRDQDRSGVALEWWPGSQRSSIATVWRTNWKAITTRQIEQILYGCRDFWMLLKFDNTSWRKTLRNSYNFMQWRVVNTLFQEMKKHHNQKDGSKETPKLGPYWKLQPVACMVSTELRSGIWSLNRNNYHSWIGISHGSNSFVMNLNNNETEIPEDQLEEYALKLDAKDFSCRSKAKAKPQRRELAGSSPRTVPIGKNLDRCWTRRIFFLRFWNIEEIDSSSSSWKTCTSRTWWSSSILEN